MNKKKGSALVETILLLAISMVLIVVLFYPQIINLFNMLMDSLSTWFKESVSMIGIIK